MRTNVMIRGFFEVDLLRMYSNASLSVCIMSLLFSNSVAQRTMLAIMGNSSRNAMDCVFHSSGHFPKNQCVPKIAP